MISDLHDIIFPNTMENIGLFQCTTRIGTPLPSYFGSYLNFLIYILYFCFFYVGSKYLVALIYLWFAFHELIWKSLIDIRN